MFEADIDWKVKHISIAETADAFVVAPATANIIAKFACGIADDAMSTLILALSCPIIICPAMNSQMYKNTITQNNITALKKLGYIFIGPETGALASGGIDSIGRLAEPQKIVAEIKKLFAISNKDEK